MTIQDKIAWEKSQFKIQYFQLALQNTDYVLYSDSAAEYLGLCNGLANDEIHVLTKQECIQKGIAFENIYGTACTTENQTINDLLKDPNMDEQVILESLAECYFKDQYASIHILPENQETFDRFRPIAEEYYCS